MGGFLPRTLGDEILRFGISVKFWVYSIFHIAKIQKNIFLKNFRGDTLLRHTRKAFFEFETGYGLLLESYISWSQILH